MFRVYDMNDNFLRSFDTWEEAMDWIKLCNPDSNPKYHYYVDEVISTPQK